MCVNYVATRLTTPIYASFENNTQLKKVKNGKYILFLKKVKKTYKINENNVYTKLKINKNQ
jgi:hypothetical protein